MTIIDGDGLYGSTISNPSIHPQGAVSTVGFYGATTSAPSKHPQGVSSAIGYYGLTTNDPAIFPKGIKGNATGVAVAAGNLGENLFAVQSAGRSFSSGTAFEVPISGGITLTPGRWQLSGAINFIPDATTTFTVINASISKTTAIAPASTIGAPDSGEIVIIHKFNSLLLGAGANYTLQIPAYIVDITVNQTYHLITSTAFASGACSASGYITATRVGS